MTNPHREAAQVLEGFLATPAPREVPHAIGIAASTRETGRVALTVGLFVFLLGSALSISLFPTDLPQQWRLKKGPTQTVTGVIDQFEPFPTRKGLTRYRYYYHFQPAGQPADQSPQRGVGYTTNLAWVPGSVVWIDYLSADPSLSVPQSGRIGPEEHPGAVALPLAFAAVGLILILIGVRSIRARHRILRDGQTTTGLVTEVEPTSVNGQRRITLIRGDNGRKATRRTHHVAEINLLTERLGTGQTVTLLYDPAAPKRVLIPDAWGR